MPVLVGNVMLKTAGMAKCMNRNVPGVAVPDGIVQKMSDARKEDRQKVSIQICAGLITQMKDLCKGAHLMTLGWDHCVPGIVQAAGSRDRLCCLSGVCDADDRKARCRPRP